MPAVGMTDHGNLFGAVSFCNSAKAAGIHPVIGCEVYVSGNHKSRTDTDRYNHLVLLCENQEGYRNLIDLISTACIEGFYYKPRIDKDLLARHCLDNLEAQLSGLLGCKVDLVEEPVRKPRFRQEIDRNRAIASDNSRGRSRRQKEDPGLSITSDRRKPSRPSMIRFQPN